jgi:hypothetical protein
MVSAGYEFGKALRSTETLFLPRRDRSMRPPPQYLRFLNIDQIAWNKPASADRKALRPSLVARHREMIEFLVKHVRLSRKTLRPIRFFRLIGHTDNTGAERYNVALDVCRTQAVKQALDDLLKEDILKRRIATIVEKGPGSSAAKADNRTALGRALNRRVEIFVAPPEPPPEPEKPIPRPDPPASVIKTAPSSWPWGQLPSRAPGKSSLKDPINNKLENFRLPKLIRDPEMGSYNGSRLGRLNFFLGNAHVSDPHKGIITALAKALSEIKAQ